MQALVMFGNRLGRSAKYHVGATIHHANEFLLVVGTTGNGKKGMAKDTAEILFQNTGQVSEIQMESEDGVEATGCLSDPLVCYSSDGLSTGAGLIYAVRDASPARGEKPDDPGIKDKRLLIIEPEFQRVLAQARKQDSTLSSTLRNLWDSGKASLKVKVEPIKTTNAHVSLIAHISPEELKSQTVAIDYQNGFLNRFWICMARRSQFISRPKVILAENYTHIRDQLRNALRSAQITPRFLTMDAQADEYYDSIYRPELERVRHGLNESLMARAAPHVCRMAVIYAMADNAMQIRLPHLRAAHALWKYSEKSAEYLFGRSTGNKHADKILALLEEAPEGMTATQIYEKTGKNLNEKVRADAMEALESQGMVIRQQTTLNGRTVDLWTAT
jgi:predicted transcriptional regulator